MILNDGNPELTPGLLAHFGVKGMKWGVRREAPPTADVKGARQRQKERQDKADRARNDLAKAKTKTAQDKAWNDFDKTRKELYNGPDRAMAQRLTKGERIAAVMLGGIAGQLVIRATDARADRLARKSG